MNLNQPDDKFSLENKNTSFFYNTGCLFELTKWIIAIIIFFTLIHFFVATIFIVDGVSMAPNFKGGEYIIANRWQYNFDKPERGDVAVLRFPGDPDERKYIKRIIGLPGETLSIKNGLVYINDVLLTEDYLPKGLKTDHDMTVSMKTDEYFLMGDNRPNSSDSRTWNVAAKRFLIGKAYIQIWPQIKIIQNVEY